MSIGILISVHDGLVLASDSASTLMLNTPQGGHGVVGVYNNANKIVNLHKDYPIGCVAFGSGSIGNSSISTLLKDFRAKLASIASPINMSDYSMAQVADELSKFLEAECQSAQKLVPGPAPTLGMLVAGYSTNKSLGEGWVIEIDNGTAKKPTLLRKEHEVGVSWGGEGEAVARLAVGFSPGLPGILQGIIKTNTSDTIQNLVTVLQQKLQAPIVFAPMPIQDAIDLAEFLVHSAIMYSRFTPGAPTVGGPIEIAAITKHEGFKWIKRKHYFEVKLNREDRAL